MPKMWYRSRRNQVVMVILFVFSLLYYMSLNNTLQREPNLDITRSDSVHHIARLHWDSINIPNNFNNRKSVIEYIEKRLEDALKDDKNTGCEIPKLDPFADEVTKFDKEMPKVVCEGRDWVKCYLSECKVVDEILKTTRDIICTYNDILYESDKKYTIGPPTEVIGADVYELVKSDHVKIKCTGKHENSILPSKWLGHGIGFRPIAPREPPPARDKTFNVMFLGFDSTSRNGFIRRMPKSYKVIKEVLGATVLDGYNIVGDGTPAALFPILTGKTELELPDVRKKMKNNGTLDSMPFIFYKLKDDGYRTAYFEDMPWIGTFQYRFNGFLHQPADHYLRAFYLEESSDGRKWWKRSGNKYCVGDTPQYALMLNITEQFFKLDGKKFCFTFIADITHDDFNMIATADDDTADFLTRFVRSGLGEDTMLLVFGDHGPRYAKVRDTLQGKLEERLPLMAIRLPDALIRSRPDAQTSLVSNSKVLTTPHDIHATILDVMEMRQSWSRHTVRGADRTRALTLLEPISKNRSCSEAGIEPHWCSCLSWESVPTTEPLYHRVSHALVDFINSLTEGVRSSCVPRSLSSTSWVLRQRANTGVLTFVSAKDADGYVGKFGDKVRPPRENYQVKISVGPGNGIYEASLTYLVKEDRFDFDTRDISRTNAYNNEPSCISATHPHLNMYCFCKEFT